MIKKTLKKFIPFRYKKQLRNFKILAFEYAQYKSIKLNLCVDKFGNFIPWYTYPSIEYLTNLDFSSKYVFEYGSGYSSFFWAKRAKYVVSVEHDEKWFNKLKLQLLNNQKLILQKSHEDYVKAIAKENIKFHVVIIDGILRDKCARNIKYYLDESSEEGFMIILDNSDWYTETAKYLREELNLIQIDFHGFGPINDYTWTTSIFLSRSFNFKPINGVQPNFSVAAIRQGETKC